MLGEIYIILSEAWQWVALLSVIAIAIGGLTHVILYQKDPRSAAFWAVIIPFIPLMGTLFYVLFGINSLRRRGKEYRQEAEFALVDVGEACPANPWETQMELQELKGLGLSLARISRLSFTIGNTVKPLRNGEEAMTGMIEAIKAAEKSVALCSYIFEAKGIGMEFVKALVAAKDRGVEVRVLVDDAGTKYSFPPVTRILRKQGVNARRYMPLRFLLRILTMNLRNHRKIMVVDGKIGFTGGMNIRQGNMVASNPSHPVQDMHFRVEGPVVRQLQRIFAEDWAFCAREVLHGEAWYPELSPVGEVAAIGIPDGPDEDADLLSKSIFAAINAAQKEVKVMTPYFLPDTRLIWALNLAALRGVHVTIITPKKNNIPFVRWAARTLYPELLERGVRIYESTGHFDHSKFMTVDGLWSLIGSTNWDPRSLRLNFEFNLACFDDQLAPDLNQTFERSLRESEEITLGLLAQTSLPERFRDGFCRLFTRFL